jgi:hypothetical protein
MNRLATATAAKLRLAALAVAFCMLASGLLLAAGSAQASSSAVDHIIATCEREEAPSGYTEQDYHEALQQLSAYAEEYTLCAELIVQAERKGTSDRQGGSSSGGGGGGAGTGAGGGTGGSTPTGGGGSTAAPATSEEQAAIVHAQQSPPSAVALGAGRTAAIHPGVIHTNVSSALKSLPDPLIAAIAAIAALIVLLLGRALRERLRFADEDL